MSGQNKESISITFFLIKCAAHKYQNARQQYVASNSISFKGSFTNYVDKKRWLGSLKMPTFCQGLRGKNVNRGGLGGQKNLST